MKTGTLQVVELPLAPNIDAVEGLSGLDWPTMLCPQNWLGHETPSEFLTVSGLDVLTVASLGEVEACFRDRCIDDGDEALIRCLLDADVACVAHALSALLSASNEDARLLMPPKICRELNGSDVEFDHIGIEVFGQLEWYIELFDRAYAPLGINVVDEHVFPSVQVRSALGYDQQLGDVRIARIHFAHGENTVNLEVFEATQSWKHIAIRQAALFAHLAAPWSRAASVSRLARRARIMPEPVGHVAFRVDDAGVVQSIQATLSEQSSRPHSSRMRPYAREATYNPADGSTNTKFVVSHVLPSGLRLESQIIEVVSYEP